MSFSDSARVSTWVILFGIVLALNGLYVGSSPLAAAGAAIAVVAYITARVVRRLLRRRHPRPLPFL
jgi:predicted PurR-regulated permease PerM